MFWRNKNSDKKSLFFNLFVVVLRGALPSQSPFKINSGGDFDCFKTFYGRKNELIRQPREQ